MGGDLPSSGAERVALATDALRQSGYLRLRVQGASMLPTLWPGDMVQVAACSGEEVAIGEILLSQREDRFYLHRLIRRDEAGELISRGDSMSRPDPAYDGSAVLGKLMSVSRNGQSRPIKAKLGFFARLLGLLCCYSSVVRQAALRFHRWRSTSGMGCGLGSESAQI